ncbi:reticulocalbin-2 isoform X1 [Pieris napi]|uniref:reticulocalbin-2 isoform X1 n=1 Tax=Pieris napi TaxID=78633 RepID=UPI001FBA7161|nr:reticulocalbin-2 isoform X1 [Pieris napi]
MYCQYYVSFVLLLTPNILFCASAAVHSHSLDDPERESDGAYRPRDSEHFNDMGHNVEFDHEAILGSVKEAEEFDKLSPEESKRRLGLMLPKMDLNGDKFIDRDELKKWILNSFINLAREEAEERLTEADDDGDGLVTWSEYLRDSFGVDTEEELNPEDTGDTGMQLVRDEKIMWKTADRNGDGKLDIAEFEVFTNPEEHSVMHPHLVSQALREKDSNGDGMLDFHEYIGERAQHQDKEWVMTERDKYDHELDSNGDGLLDEHEIHRWMIPDNNEIAEEEVSHLFASSDDDHDELLSFEEILQHHHVFVGSEATDFGNDIDRFDDEL